MATLKFSAPVNTGNAIGNAIRSMLIEYESVVKPIAFKLSDGSTQFTPSDQIIDTTMFASMLSELIYNVDEHACFPLVTQIVFSGELKTSDMSNSDMSVYSPRGENDKILLHSLDSTQVTLTLVLNKSQGYSSTNDNRQLLMNSGISCDSYNIISSRHVTFTVEPPQVSKQLATEEVTIRVNSAEKNEHTIITNTLQKLSEILEGITIQ